MPTVELDKTHKPITSCTKRTSAAERDRFIEDMLPYVKYLAHRVAANLPPSVDLNDLINYGVIGLLDACRKFDPEKGVKFKTYAETRIRGAILDGMRAADWVPRSVRRKRRDLEQAWRHTEQDLGRPATSDEVAKRLNVPVGELREMMRDVQGVALGSLEELTSDLGESGERIAIGYAHDPDGSDPQTLVEREELRSIVCRVVAELPEKERIICSLYYYEELTMKEIGMTLGISESRVSQLHTKAMLRVRERIEEVCPALASC